MIFVYSLYAAVSILIVAGILRGRNGALWAIGFAQHIGGVSFFVGVALNWPKIMPFFALVMIPFFGIRPRLRDFPLSKVTIFLLLYGAVVSLWFWLVDPEAETLRNYCRAAGWGAGQTDYRYIIQYTAFFGTWALPFAVFLLARDKKGVEALFKGFLFGALASVGLGLYQCLSPISGLPWADSQASGAMVQGSLGLREIVQVFNLFPGVTLQRLYGMGGEPKHTAGLLVFTLCLIAAVSLSRVRFAVPSWKIILLLVGLLLSISTSGWIAAAAIATLAIPKTTLTGRRKALTFVASSFLLLGLIGAFFTTESGRNLYEVRVASRIEQTMEGGVEYKDQAVLTLISNEPSKALFGLGLGGADFFLIKYRPRSIPIFRSGMTPTYLFTRVLAELGIVGLSAIFIAFLVVRKKMKMMDQRTGLNFLYFGSIGALLVPYATFHAFLVLLAGFLSLCRNPVMAKAEVSLK